MERKGELWSLVLLIALVAAAGFILFYAYNSYLDSNGESQIFHSEDYDRNISALNLSSSSNQFMNNLRFPKNNISYYFEEDCSVDKINRIIQALNIIESRTDNLYFYQTTNRNGDIVVACSRESLETEENVFIAGEGGPTKIVNSTLYPIILEAKVIIYEETSCELPITELHELFHVLGFDHVNDKNSIMYPYINCEQEIDEYMLETITRLYAVPSLPDLFFANISAVKNGRYLNINLTVENEGLYIAKNISLTISSDGEEIYKHSMGDLDFGEGKTLYLTNNKLPSRQVNLIKIEVSYPGKELNEYNNLIEMGV